jgi:hypothetical protein
VRSQFPPSRYNCERVMKFDDAVLVLSPFSSSIVSHWDDNLFDGLSSSLVFLLRT